MYAIRIDFGLHHTLSIGYTYFVLNISFICITTNIKYQYSFRNKRSFTWVTFCKDVWFRNITLRAKYLMENINYITWKKRLFKLKTFNEDDKVSTCRCSFHMQIWGWYVRNCISKSLSTFNKISEWNGAICVRLINQMWDFLK